MIDCDEIERETNEEWLNKTNSSYLLSAYEEVVSEVKVFVLADKVWI
jgi:hypothetical protein